MQFHLHIHLYRRAFWSCGLALCVLGTPGITAAQPAADNGRVVNGAAPRGFLPEPGIIRRGIDFATRTIDDGGGGKEGFYPEFSNMPTGAGWISVGPGYRRWVFNDQAILDGSTAVSWRSYKMAQGRFELAKLANSRLAIGTQARWQDLTQVNYFGTGPASLDDTRSEYRLRSTNVVGYTTVRPTQWLAVAARVGWLASPDLLSPAGTFKRGNPPTRELFADDVVYTLEAQPSFGHRELSVIADTRDHRSHPLAGGVYRAAWSAYSDQDFDRFSFNRYEAEAAHFIPVAGSRIVFALHGWLVASNPTDGNTVPFYLQPSVGGANTIRAYTDFRFHDRNLLSVNAESRIALFDHVDAALFVDAGSVAPKVGDLDLDRRAYGLGFRMHSQRSTFARFDMAHGDDGWRLLLRTNDPLHLTRLSRRTAAIPFVP